MRDRLKLWATDLRLVGSTALRSLSDDPLQFLVQVARRAGKRSKPHHQRPTVLNAYRWFLADRPEVAARLLAESRHGPGLRRRLARRLLVQLGADRAHPSDPDRLRWLDRTQVGDLSGALAQVKPESAAGRRTASELRLLEPSPSEHPRIPLQPSAAGSHRALFVLTNSLPYTKSGYTYRSHAILKALNAVGVAAEASTRIGYPSTVGIPGRPRTAVVDGVRYHRIVSAGLPLELDKRLDEQVSMLEPLASSFKPTVLHCTTDYTNAVVTQALAERLGLPWVYEMRGQLEQSWVASRPAALKDAAASSERVRLLRAKEAELAANASAVITLSGVQKDDLTSRGVPAERIHVIPNGIDASLFEETTTPSDARRALGLPAEGFWVGSVSSLVDYEGFDTLLRAVAEARKTGADIRCILVGDGVSRPSLLGLGEELALADVVVMPGRVPPTEATRWYQAIDAFVVPRRDTSVTRVVTPLKPLEAMALARPVLVSDLPALNEIVVSPGAGWNFRAGNAAALADLIIRLAEDSGQRSELGARGKIFARGRTWQNAAKVIADIYDGKLSGEIR